MKINDMISLKKGFTLIELIIVMAILSIVAIGLIAALDPVEQVNRGNDTKDKSSAAEISKALDRYYANNNSYPAVATVLSDLVADGDLKYAPTGVTVAGGSSASKYYACFTFRSKATKADTVNAIYNSLPSGATVPTTTCSPGLAGDCTVICLR